MAAADEPVAESITSEPDGDAEDDASTGLILQRATRFVCHDSG